MNEYRSRNHFSICVVDDSTRKENSVKTWNLKAGYYEGHPSITESTTGVVACGDSWCSGQCGLPALVLQVSYGEQRAFGIMVAHGRVFQPFRTRWDGEKVAVTLGDTTIEQALHRIWL